MSFKTYLIYPLLLGTQFCFAQNWTSLGIGPNNPVTKLFVDSVDNLMYVGGGGFTEVNGDTMWGIAGWDGSQWDSLGHGIDRYPMGPNMPANILGMARYGNFLYAGGSFRVAGNIATTALARWNGTDWDSVPGGYISLYHSVDDIIVYNNELYICGTFDSIGNLPVHGIAKWNGSIWDSIGNNYNFLSSFGGSVLRMKFYHGNLYVSGDFEDSLGNTRRLARWDGNSWTFFSVFTGATEAVWDMEIYNDELYVSGLCYTQNGNMGNSIIKWNDTTWSDVGGSMQVENNPFPRVCDMCVYSGKLYCVGNFEKVGGIPAVGLASWDGTQWCSYATTFSNVVQQIAFFNDTMYVAGAFNIANGDGQNYIAKWIGGNYVDTCGSTTDIPESNSNSVDFTLYPNPLSGSGTFEAHGTDESFTLVICDQLGREVLRKVSNGIQLDFSTDGISPGLYYYSISQEGEVQKTGKMIID